MKVGVTFGAFDMLHPGHLTFLRDCKQYCDFLIVGLHVDPSQEREWKNKPVQSSFERYVQLISCKYVDEVIPYDSEQDLCNILGTQTIHVRFLGEDYKNTPIENISGGYICVEKNIEIKFLDRKHSFSSTELRKRLNNESR